MQWDPEDYAAHSSAQLVWAQELLAKLDLSGGEALLDVGCGDGRITAVIAQSLPGGRVLGVDSSADFIAYAREHYLPLVYPNLHFECMDARKLAWEQSFDIIFSNATLHWVDDHRAFLVGCARLLNPGGRLIVSCGGRGNAAAIISALEAVTRQPRWRDYFSNFSFPYYFHTTEDYAQWLPEAGFIPIRLALVEKDMTHHGRDGLAGGIRTTWMPYTQRLPQARREEFIDEIVTDYLAQLPLDAAGCSHVRMVRLEVEAHT
jgi:trans-aconitate 2-methyltransferase